MSRPEDVRSQVPPGGWDRPVAGAPQITAPYAGWWSRVGATIVDSIIVLIPATVLGALIFGGVAAAAGDDEGGFFAAVLAILAYMALLAVALFVYAPLLMRRPGEKNGQTWGKQLFGIRVVRTNGVPMDFIWSGLREVVVKVLGLGVASAFIPLLPWLLDVLWPLWDDENRAVHDFIVETRVVQA
jgi:uncharacterized RDD family membrane protein YckC